MSDAAANPLPGQAVAATVGDLRVQAPPRELEREPLVRNQRSPGWISDAIAGVAEGKTPRWWWCAFIPSVTFLTIMLCMILYLMSVGVGVWGPGHPIMWGWAIVNFVWWIGIGHAGTLISAILFLLRQKWRTSINRAAEAMTIFAVMCAGIFPLIHIGRIWFGWWLFPIPNQQGIWPQFRSPLMWDVFAVSTYFTVSVLFWYMGLIPDLAVMRDRAKTKIRKFGYGLFSLGWTGSNRHWSNYEKAYLILAGLSTPLVLSVHSIVSMDFSVSQVPGWHTTIFPPYFVAGAVFSGFGMVLSLLIPLRKVCRAGGHHHRPPRRIDVQSHSGDGLALSVTPMRWNSSSPGTAAILRKILSGTTFILNRATGHYAWALLDHGHLQRPRARSFSGSKKCAPTCSSCSSFPSWSMSACGLNGSSSSSPPCIANFMPSNWSYFRPTWVDILTYLGTFGLFFTFFLLFLRFIPIIAISEVKGVTPQADPHHPLGGATKGGHH